MVAPSVLSQLPLLADPVRGRLLLLLEPRELAVGDLEAALQLPQSTVSRHLRALADAGWVTSRAEGTSRLYRAELRARLSEPKEADITDGQRFNTVLAFLGLLDSPAAQAAVLRRRLAFLETPASFFYREGAPVRAEQEPDLFRAGMLRIARATGTAEKAWLKETLALLDG